MGQVHRRMCGYYKLTAGFSLFPLRAASLAALVAAAFAPLPSSAQEASASQGAIAPFCSVREPETDVEGQADLFAICGDTGINLGPVESYVSFYNPALQATLVKLERYGRTRVMVLRPGADGRPMAEDLTGSLAIAAGRSATSGLEGLVIAPDQFVATGVIGVMGESMVSPVNARASEGPVLQQGAMAAGGVASELDVAALIDADRRRSAAARAMPAEEGL